MTRKGRRGRVLGIPEPEEDQFDEETQRRMLENAGIEVEDMTEEERKGILAGNADVPQTSAASAAAIDIESDKSCNRDEDEATEAPDHIEATHASEVYDTSSTTSTNSSEDERQKITLGPRFPHQKISDSLPVHSTSDLTENIQDMTPPEVEKLKSKLSSKCSEENAQVVLDSEDEEETQAYDIQQGELLVANTQRSPSQERTVSPGFAIPESQSEGSCDEPTLLPHDDDQISESHIEKCKSPLSAASIKINSDESTGNTPMPSFCRKTMGYRTPSYFAPDWMKDAGDYACVIKLLLANYVAKLARAQRTENPDKWGKPVRAGPHVDGCLRAKCKAKFEDELSAETKTRGGRELRKRNVQGVNEFLMGNARKREAEREEDDDFENPEDHFENTCPNNSRVLGTRLRNKRAITFNEEDDELVFGDHDQGKRKCTRRTGRKMNAKDIMDEEDARELFSAEDARELLNSEENNDSGNEWIPPMRKETVKETAGKEGISLKKKGRGRKPKKEDEKQPAIINSPWLRKGNRLELREKGKRKENVDSDQEEEMIFSVKSKPEQDSYTRLFNQPLMVLDKEKSLDRKFSWSDDSDDICLPIIPSAAKKKHKGTLRNEDNLTLIKGGRKKGDGLNVKEKVQLTSVSDVKSFDSSADSESSNDKIENFESIKTKDISADILKTSDDEDSCFEIENPIKDSEKPVANVKSSQETFSGIPQSQSSNSLLDMHGNLYSTQFGITGEREKLSHYKKRNKGGKSEYAQANASVMKDFHEQSPKCKLDPEIESGVSKRKIGNEESVFKTLKLRRIEDKKQSAESSKKRSEDDLLMMDDKEENDLELDPYPATKSESGKRKHLSRAVISHDDGSLKVLPQKRRKLNLCDNSDNNDQVKGSEESGIEKKSVGVNKSAKKKGKIKERKPLSRNFDADIRSKDPEIGGTEIPTSDTESPNHNEEMDADEGNPEAVPSPSSQLSSLGTCPICSSTFPLKQLEMHASTCGEEAAQESDEDELRKCIYCNLEVIHKELKHHQAHCSQAQSNPSRIRTTRSGRGAAGPTNEK